MSGRSRCGKAQVQSWQPQPGEAFRHGTVRNTVRRMQDPGHDAPGGAPAGGNARQGARLNGRGLPIPSRWPDSALRSGLKRRSRKPGQRSTGHRPASFGPYGKCTEPGLRRHCAGDALRAMRRRCCGAASERGGLKQNAVSAGVEPVESCNRGPPSGQRGKLGLRRPCRQPLPGLRSEPGFRCRWFARNAAALGNRGARHRAGNQDMGGPGHRVTSLHKVRRSRGAQGRRTRRWHRAGSSGQAKPGPRAPALRICIGHGQMFPPCGGKCPKRRTRDSAIAPRTLEVGLSARKDEMRAGTSGIHQARRIARPGSLDGTHACSRPARLGNGDLARKTAADWACLKGRLGQDPCASQIRGHPGLGCNRLVPRIGTSSLVADTQPAQPGQGPDDVEKKRLERQSGPAPPCRHRRADGTNIGALPPLPGFRGGMPRLAGSCRGEKQRARGLPKDTSFRSPVRQKRLRKAGRRPEQRPEPDSGRRHKIHRRAADIPVRRLANPGLPMARPSQGRSPGRLRKRHP